ncbi:2-C-methyl-D-erythritol 4-phosphate cytidylyltransferase [Allofrancisella guangzhouensis]|nr:2-C-methyl-D-erythritol 4-phosphate cytidylyltransferase [Allofrancisella guangzhouensis]MBK2027341.1 2-C-methyl-D-erythritol 4-phosphate cytidylyltransferase [Allofrancisella guangzhouensis]MBK2044771.1 2-C-methyl-D-erythritol 4-phosphate cytidylyltransferase [Allofrancisella guangzhouensis]MBK2045243.1 2-C-methyl-D-erythritol 4-phosphate cytidylyltransferase [Allofrancisella guangzhouensis]
MALDIPKQYFKLISDKTILDTTLEKFVSSDFFNKVILSLNKDDNLWKDSIYFNHPKIVTCTGGDTRFDSVYNALKQIQIKPKVTTWIFVHDAARPNVMFQDIENLYEAVKESKSKSGVLGIRAFETVKQVTSNSPITIDKTLNRDYIWLAQTPQLCELSLLYKAFEHCKLNNLAKLVTDEASALELYGVSPLITQGSRNNIKVTTQEDLELINWLCQV